MTTKDLTYGYVVTIGNRIFKWFKTEEEMKTWIYIFETKLK